MKKLLSYLLLIELLCGIGTVLAQTQQLDPQVKQADADGQAYFNAQNHFLQSLGALIKSRDEQITALKKQLEELTAKDKQSVPKKP